jgi:hypothetical protein
MQISAPTEARVLVVADWTIDPHEVVAACAQRRDGAVFVLTVPAWLHGLDWAGDPTASAPCARRQLELVAAIATAAGVPVELAGVGDPDPLSAIVDALDADAHGATEILLLERRRRFGGSRPWDLVHRVQRLTGLPVTRMAASPATGSSGRRGRAAWRGGGHCDAEGPRAA